MKTLEQKVYDGQRAKEVLENEVFQSVFDDIEKELHESWKSSPVRDEAGREKLFLMTMLLNKVRQSIMVTLETGTLAKAELQHKQTMRDRLNDWLG